MTDPTPNLADARKAFEDCYTFTDMGALTRNAWEVERTAKAYIPLLEAALSAEQAARARAEARQYIVQHLAHVVMEDVFAFPVNTEAQVYVSGYDTMHQRQRLSLWGDTAADILRLKRLVDEYEASRQALAAPPSHDGQEGTE